MWFQCQNIDDIKISMYQDISVKISMYQDIGVKISMCQWKSTKGWKGFNVEGW